MYDHKVIFKVTPMGKPRMTQRDKWKKRPVVESYWAYRDAVTLHMNKTKFVMPTHDFRLVFIIPMPKSMSKKDKDKHRDEPHQKKPDIDNLAKAFFDAVCKEDDSHIWDGRFTKVWGDKGRIVVQY